MLAFQRDSGLQPHSHAASSRGLGLAGCQDRQNWPLQLCGLPEKLRLWRLRTQCGIYDFEKVWRRATCVTGGSMESAL